jgi:hypothetical protein
MLLQPSRVVRCKKMEEDKVWREHFPVIGGVKREEREWR